MAQRVLFIILCLVCCFFPEVHSQSASIKSENTPSQKERVIRQVDNDGNPEVAVYNGQTYKVEIGRRGGHYIVIGQDSTGKDIKRYISKAKPTLVDLGNGTASYKGKTWPIQTGQKGGRFILIPNDRGGTDKRYLPKQK
jgi:hypothetical protein